MAATAMAQSSLDGDDLRQTLPSRVYVDPETFALEQEKIFSRSWQYVCHVEKLRNPGDYLVAEIAGESIIAIRGRNGGLHAFFNVCRHRAARLLEGEGCKKRIACPYHAWTYDTDGRLLSAPNAKQVRGFDPFGYRLTACGLEELHGLVFVNLDAAARPLTEQAEGLEAEIKAYAPGLPELTFVHRTEARLAANWKVAVENYSECYHCALLHPDFVKGVVDPRSYRVRVHGLWQKHLSEARKGAAKAYAFDEAASPMAERFGAWWLWPNFAFQSYPGGAVHVWKWTPIDVGCTQVTVDWYFPTADLKDWERDLIRHHAETTFAEDIPIVERVQQGLASRAYKHGPLMIDAEQTHLSEHGVAAIQDLWRDALEDRDA